MSNCAKILEKSETKNSVINPNCEKKRRKNCKTFLECFDDLNYF